MGSHDVPCQPQTLNSLSVVDFNGKDVNLVTPLNLLNTSRLFAKGGRGTLSLDSWTVLFV